MPGVTAKYLDEHVVSFLKKSPKLVGPVQTEFIKTGEFKKIAPPEAGCFYTLCASIMRRLYIRSPSGVAVYGGRDGFHPFHYCGSSDCCFRKALRALEVARMVEKHPDGGRKLTSKGQRVMDRIANQIVVKHRRNKEPCVITLD